jgi:hypothetical protein
LQGKSWDKLEFFCSEDNTSFEAVIPRTERGNESEIIDKVEGQSVVTIVLIVTGVLLVCAVVGGIILVKVVKRRRNRPATPEYCDVYAPRASYVSIHSYAEVGEGSSYISVQSYTDVDSDSINATGYSYAAVQ